LGGELDGVPGAAKGWSVTQVQVAEPVNGHGVEQGTGRDVDALGDLGAMVADQLGTQQPPSAISSRAPCGRRGSWPERCDPASGRPGQRGHVQLVDRLQVAAVEDLINQPTDDGLVGLGPFSSQLSVRRANPASLGALPIGTDGGEVGRWFPVL
jgi:hypothetical protein